MRKFERANSNLLTEDDETWINDKYQVNIKFLEKKKGLGKEGWIWLSIKSKNKKVIRDWRIFQKIKNMLAGEEREGVELYPAESRLVDTSNQFHIFVMPKGDRFPFGYAERMLVKGHSVDEGIGSGQRAFQPNEEPEDAVNIKEALEKQNIITKAYVGKDK